MGPPGIFSVIAGNWGSLQVAGTVLAGLIVAGACTSSDRSGGPGAATTTSEGQRPTTALPVDVDEVATDPEFRIADDASGYRVVYLVESLGDRGEPTPDTTETVHVVRPYEGRLEVAEGAPPGGEVTSLQMTTFDRLRLGGPRSALVVHRVPDLAVSDVRVGPVLDRAVAEGLVDVGGQKVVAGRRCQVLRTATLLGAGPLRPITASESAESCVDAAGVLLEEILLLDGEPALRRVAVSVEIGPDVEPGTFEPGPVVAPVDQGGGSVLPVDPDTAALGEFWALPDDAVPGGFARHRRYAVIPAQPERFDEDPAGGTPIAGTVDVYRRGPDALIVFQGATAGGDDAFAPMPGAIATDAGSLGAGELVLSATGSEVRVDRGDGRFVHVRGSLPPDDLIEVARSLDRIEGTGLVYL